MSEFGLRCGYAYDLEIKNEPSGNSWAISKERLVRAGEGETHFWPLRFHSEQNEKNSGHICPNDRDREVDDAPEDTNLEITRGAQIRNTSFSYRSPGIRLEKIRTETKPRNRLMWENDENHKFAQGSDSTLIYNKTMYKHKNHKIMIIIINQVSPNMYEEMLLYQFNISLSVQYMIFGLGRHQ